MQNPRCGSVCMTFYIVNAFEKRNYPDVLNSQIKSKETMDYEKFERTSNVGLSLSSN